MIKVALLFLVAGVAAPQTFPSTTPPAVIGKVDPDYTKEATDAKVEGSVILSLLVGIDGVPSRIEVIRGLGKGLDEKAIECLRKWRFRPAENGGMPVPEKAVVEMVFRMT
jgi:protein TonB